jgi:hypothetical protein
VNLSGERWEVPIVDRGLQLNSQLGVLILLARQNKIGHSTLSRKSSGVNTYHGIAPMRVSSYIPRPFSKGLHLIPLVGGDAELCQNHACKDSGTRP